MTLVLQLSEISVPPFNHHKVTASLSQYLLESVLLPPVIHYQPWVYIEILWCVCVCVRAINIACSIKNWCSLCTLDAAAAACGMYVRVNKKMLMLGVTKKTGARPMFVMLTTHCLFLDVPCQGVYDWKYTILYNDQTAGATNIKKLWDDGRKNAVSYTDSENKQFAISCDCCASFQQWKRVHPQ